MTMVERNLQLASFRDLLDRCHRGDGGAALLTGPVACGRTELLHACTRTATEEGARHLGATGSPDERALPLGAVSQLLRTTALPPAARRHAADLLDRATRAAEAGADRPETTRLLFELCLVLTDLAQDGPLLVTVDDAQYLDDLSARWLGFLVRRLVSTPILLLVTVADDHLRPEHTELVRGPGSRRITVPALTPAGTAALLPGADPTAAAGLHAASGGNPLLARALLDSHGGVTTRHDTYRRALAQCLRRCHPRLVRAVRAAAVLGAHATGSGTARLAGLSGAETDEALHAAQSAGLTLGPRLRLPAGRAAVLADLTPGERHTLHYEAARLLHERGAAATETADQLLTAGAPQEPWAVQVLLEAADAALAGGDVHAAVLRLELAHTVETDEHHRATVLARLAAAEWLISPAATDRHLTPLVTASRTGHLGPRHRIMLLRQLLWLDRHDEAADVLAHIRAADQEPGTVATTAVHATELWLACTHPTLARRGRPAVRAGDVVVALRADPWLPPASILASILLRARDAEAAGRAEQMLRDVRLGTGTPWAAESPLLALVYADRTDSAAAWCDRLLTDVGGLGFPAWQAVFSGIRAEIAIRRGAFPAALDAARSALAHISAKGWGVAVGMPLSALVLAATRTGDLDTAAAHLDHPVPEGMALSRYQVPYLHARGQYYLAAGNRHAALADFLACGELTRAWGIDVPGLVPWRISAAEAWLSLGNRDEARNLLSDQLARLGPANRRARAMALRALAACAPPERRPRLLTSAVEAAEDSGDRYELARALGDLGLALRHVKEGARSRMTLRRAWQVARACRIDLPGAAPLDAGGPAGATLPGVLARVGLLSEAEHRVAALAAVGYTNREIAARLFVTASTVEQHLTRVYRKLQVKRRSDLPADLHSDFGRAG
ncbi:AAA family ATPase [Streptomyces sp. NPDC050560]|uniref:AAA family ATPase n=1 Tax=Streptomyces sp. NPDC050560 TaxID=3365630 RepID=UPI003790F829